MIEDKFNRNSRSKFKRMEVSLKIVPYSISLKSYFKVLNVEWLESYFSVTEADLKILSSPEVIIEKGGSVLFVSMNDRIVGTCALIKENDHTFELIKMGVTPTARGKHVGDFLLKAAIEEARLKGGKLIWLETAALLEAAVGLYKKYGFVQVGGEEVHPMFGRITFRMERKIDE